MPTQGPKNKTSPCFCRYECPPGTRPWRNYAVGGDDVNFPEYFPVSRLYSFTTKVDERCEWNATDPLPGYGTEVMNKHNIDPGISDHAYRIEVLLNKGIIATQYSEEYPWDDDDFGIPGFEPACDAVFELLSFGPVPTFMNCVPVPHWLCTQQEYEDWNDGINPDFFRDRMLTAQERRAERT